MYITMCVYSCTCTLCENSVRNKNPMSLLVVQAQSVCAYLCVRICVCVVCVCGVCVCVCVCVAWACLCACVRKYSR